LNVEIPESVDKPKRHAKMYARRFFEQVHGSSPSKIVVQHEEHRYPADDVIPYTVMVSDHSSGSLNDGKQYEVNVDE